MSETDGPAGRIFVVTGAPSSGKTSAGRALAEALPKAVFIDGPTLEQFVVTGQAQMEEPPSVEQIEQVLLRYAAALTLADVYRAGGFDVVIADDLIDERLEDFLELADPEPIHLVVLHPSAEALAERGDRLDIGTATGLHNLIEHHTPRIGLWIDNSVTTVPMTVLTILRGLDEALIEPADDSRENADTDAAD